MKKLRILIADDHGMIRRGVRSVIEVRRDWEICGEAGSGREAIELARQLRPDIVVMDHTMPGLNGLDATRKIRAALPDTQVLILTAHDSETLVREMRAAGAHGFVLKSEAPGILPKAIEALVAGRTYFTAKYADLAAATPSGSVQSAEAPSGRLTPRERELVQLLAEGKSNKEAAMTLGISLNTVETHRKNVMSKLALRSASDLVRYAVRENLIMP